MRERGTISLKIGVGIITKQMNSIGIQIKGATQQIEKFIEKITEDALFFEVSRMPCIGERIELGTPNGETQVFRVTEVIHYTFSDNDFPRTWGRITVEPCDLFLQVSKEFNEQEDEEWEPDGDVEPDELKDEEWEPDEDAEPDENGEVEEMEPGKKRPPTPRRGRLPRGIMTPEEDYKLPILEALDELGGSARTKTVLMKVKKLMRGVLKEVDYQIVSAISNEIRWQKSAKWAYYRLKIAGLVKNDSRRGFWEISEAGRQYLADLKQVLMRLK